MKWVLFLFLVLFSFSVSAEWVSIGSTPDEYRQTIESGTWSNNYTWAFDGNYSSFTTCTSTSCQGYIYMNFTNSTLLLNSNTVIWMVKDGKGTVNLTLPIACLNTSNEEINVYVGSFISGGNDPSAKWGCRVEAGNYVELRSTGYGAGYSLVYESTLFYNYTAPPAPAPPSVQDQTFLFLGAYAAIGIGLIVAYSFFSQGRKKRR